MWYTRNRYIRAFSDFQARMFGWTSANMISVYRILIAACLPPLIVMGLTVPAVGIFVLAVYLDFIDGAVARYQQDKMGFRTDPEEEAALPFFARLRLKGCTETGKWLDPFSDKFLIQTALFSVGWGILPLPFLLSGLMLSVALTLVRPVKSWMKRRGLRKTADGRANAFGKIKMWCEVATVIALFGWHEERFAELVLQLIAVYTLMMMAVLLACLSLIFHLMPARKSK